MKNTDFTEQWTAMQKMFLPTSAISAPLRDNAQRFWENQDKVLDSMQARCRTAKSARGDQTIVWMADHTGAATDDGSSLAGDFDGQFHQTFRNIEKTLKQCGCTVFLGLVGRDRPDRHLSLLKII